jgi:predicted RNase H-like HicB family nuclease
MITSLEPEQASDGRWVAEVPGFPGVLAYGESREEALENARVLAHRVLAECLDEGDTAP